MTKSCCLEKKTECCPIDRGKQVVTRNLMTDANGISRSLVVVAASTHDIKWVAGTLDAIWKGRQEQKTRLCLYKGDEACGLKIYPLGRRYKPHIPSHKVESDAGKGTNFRAHRWGVKNTLLEESVSPLPDSMEKSLQMTRLCCISLWSYRQK